MNCMANLRVTLYPIGDETHRVITQLPPAVFYTNPMTYAAIFGYGTNPGRPIKGARLNFPLWGHQYATLGADGILKIPRSPPIPVRVIGVYSPRKWASLMSSSHAGPMNVVFPNSEHPPTHGCILEFI